MRTVVKRLVELTWTLVDAKNPPVMQAIGCILAGSWVICTSFPEKLLDPDNTAMVSMAVMFTDTSWGVISGIVFCLCFISMLIADRDGFRKLTVFCLWLYCHVLGFLVLVGGRPDRPIGWVHMWTGIFAALAFFRPLLLHYLEILKEKTFES